MTLTLTDSRCRRAKTLVLAASALLALAACSGGGSGGKQNDGPPAITLGERITGTVRSADHVDDRTLPITRPGTLTIATTGSSNRNIRVLDASGAEIPRQAGSWTVTITDAILAKGNYVIIQFYGGTVGESYSATTSFAADPAPDQPAGGGQAIANLLENWQRYQAGNPTLEMTGAEIKAAFLATLEGSLVMIPGPVACASAPSGGCQVSIITQRLDEEDLSLLQSSTLAPVLKHGSIPLAKAEFNVTYVDYDDGGLDDLNPEDQLVSNEVRSYGAWLDHAAFSAFRSHATSVTGTESTFPEAAAYIIPSGSPPSGAGSATWTGLMVGMEDARDGFNGHVEPDVFLGDAQIRIDDLAAPTGPLPPGQDPGELMNLDVSFTNIWNVTEQTPAADMIWQDLNVTGEGAFSFGRIEGVEVEHLIGRFAGPAHQEVVGEFRRNGIVGSFGAER